jgi:hypothetical protein
MDVSVKNMVRYISAEDAEHICLKPIRFYSPRMALFPVNKLKAPHLRYSPVPLVTHTARVYHALLCLDRIGRPPVAEERVLRYIFRWGCERYAFRSTHHSAEDMISVLALSSMQNAVFVGAY